MKSLKELYTIGSGPSSSHTIGPEKAALYTIKQYPNATNFEVTLFETLALTGKGHLTDAIILKVLGEDRTKIFFDFDKKTDHPNTFIIKVLSNNEVLGIEEFVSVGGGTIKIKGKSQEESRDVYPFNSFDEIKEYVRKNNMSLPDVVYQFEGEDVKEYLYEVYEVMSNAIDRGLVTGGVLPGKLKVERKAPILAKAQPNELQDIRSRRIISSYAYAVSEENASGGKIVTAPTCGACGILPAILKFVEKKYKISKDKIIDALAVASLFGNIIKKNASISGAYAGCQAEVGSACSMAAAAGSFLRGNTIEQIECAAEIAMEHFLGLTCDPIEGLVQIPCIERNAVAALRAADAALLASFINEGRKISFDTVVHTMYETGKDLKQDYRETAMGGLAKNYKC